MVHTKVPKSQLTQLLHLFFLQNCYHLMIVPLKSPFLLTCNHSITSHIPFTKYSAHETIFFSTSKKSNSKLFKQYYRSPISSHIHWSKFIRSHTAMFLQSLMNTLLNRTRTTTMNNRHTRISR